MHIRIRLGTKFQLVLAILIFCTKGAEMWYFPFKAGKNNFTIKFNIPEIVRVPNFSLDRQF